MPSMLVGVPRETAEGERRVALVPEGVRKLAAKGLDVVVEAGAGAGALLPDEHFTDAGATIGDPWSADVVVKVAAPSSEETGKLKSGAVLIAFLAPRTNPEIGERLSQADVTAFAM